MFLPIPLTRPFAHSFCWIFILGIAVGTAACLNSAAFGQASPEGLEVRTAMDYSDEQPDWLIWVAGSRKSTSSTGWWPSWKMPSWGKSKSQGWWSSSKSGSSYSRDNKTFTQKVSQTSKRWWNNTLEFLDPWAEPKPKATQSGSSSGGFGKMFGWHESEQKFNSVPEWMGQPTPK
jgi:hypothetical protein